MMTRDGGKNRDQIEFTSLDELVPEDHLVRKLENAIDWSFIYGMVEDSYCENNGRPSLDPVILIKLPVVQYMFGIRSMRQTIQEIKVNNTNLNKICYNCFNLSFWGAAWCRLI